MEASKHWQRARSNYSQGQNKAITLSGLTLEINISNIGSVYIIDCIHNCWCVCFLKIGEYETITRV